MLIYFQVKIWFQNRRNKWKRQIATDVDGLGIGISAAAAVAGVMSGGSLFGNLPSHLNLPHHHQHGPFGPNHQTNRPTAPNGAMTHTSASMPPHHRIPFHHSFPAHLVRPFVHMHSRNELPWNMTANNLHSKSLNAPSAFSGIKRNSAPSTEKNPQEKGTVENKSDDEMDVEKERKISHETESS